MLKLRLDRSTILSLLVLVLFWLFLRLSVLQLVASPVVEGA